MLALRLPPDIEKRLDDLARRTGRTKSYYAREALIEHLDDLEDIYLAQQRVEENGPRISLDDMIEKYGLGRDDET
ncbi:TraY domain-containing protein [Aquibium carbonis]|uniref:Relaxosome protein TraY n=1 Tax=Aquibium carbonis TaxID=2495581 RepID=A0A3S0A5M5_9HYPH|nr:TraY domain-containing protein [Aquibium carbonis]RST84463.1 TraY domain-containing protein [Aquibium carbonis]